MPTFDFYVITTAEPDTDQLDRIFEAFRGDATPGVTAGTPNVAFTLAAPTLTDALRTASRTLREIGLGVVRFEVEPDVVEA